MHLARQLRDLVENDGLAHAASTDQQHGPMSAPVQRRHVESFARGRQNRRTSGKLDRGLATDRGCNGRES